MWERVSSTKCNQIAKTTRIIRQFVISFLVLPITLEHLIGFWILWHFLEANDDLGPMGLLGILPCTQYRSLVT
jgi:hypothetical protein